jgi:hypothetical protein
MLSNEDNNHLQCKKTTNNMKREKIEYTSPMLEILEFVIEQGYQNSMEDPEINDEMDW